MSGLVTYFLDFLPGVSNKEDEDYGDNDDVQDNGNDDNERTHPTTISYQKSLESLRHYLKDPSSSSSLSLSTTQNTSPESIAIAAAAAAATTVTVSPNDDGGGGDMKRNHEMIEYTDPWTVQDWRNFQKRSIENYLYRRIGADEDISDSDDDDDDDDIDNGGDDKNEDDEKDDDEERFETQQQFDGSYSSSIANGDTETSNNNNNNNNNSNSKKSKDNKIKPPRRRRIPHIHQAIHTVTNNMDYIDMFTSELQLNDCEITKVWRLSDTKRGLDDDSISASTTSRIPIYPGRLPRLSYPYRDEDGPLSSVYRYVVSLELTSPQNKKRICVFLYNSYALAFDRWYNNIGGDHHHQQKKKKNQTDNVTRKTNKILVNMQQVPAICIFPFAIDPRNWVDGEELLEYCLCFGDDSSVRRFDQVTGKYQRLRLDESKMELSFLQVSNGTHQTGTELTLSQDMLDGGYSNKPDSSRREGRGTVPKNKKVPPRPLLPQQYDDKDKEEKKEDDDEDKDREDVANVEQISSSKKRERRPVQIYQQGESSNIDEMTFEGNAKRRKKVTENVDYITLDGLKNALKAQQGNPNLTFNLYAVVLGFTCARQTKRGDWMMTATLVDESVNENPITIVIFCKERQNLPILTKAGDILRMHRVYVNAWKGDVQLSGRRPSSYVVARHNVASNSNSWSVVPSAKDTFVFTSKDEERTQQLWHWGKCFLEQYPTIKPQHCFTVANLAIEGAEDRIQDRDLTVMVTAKYPNPREERNNHAPCGFLRVWDGTGDGPNDPLPIRTQLARNTQREGDPPPESLVKISGILENLNLSEEMETPKALCGKVSNVWIWEESFWDLVTNHVQVGAFIRLRNVDARRWRDHDFRSIMVNAKSWLYPIPGESYEVRSLLTEHNKRMLRSEYNPHSGLLPLSQIPPPIVNYGTSDRLGYGLASYASNPVGSFVGTVNLVETVPVYESSLTPFCKQSPDGSTFVYCFAVTIVDSSAKLDVLVNDSAGEKIIGMPASMAVGTTRRKDLQLVQPDVEWVAKLMTLTVNGMIFHVLVDISEA